MAAAAGQLYVGSAASPGQWEAIPAGDIAPLCLVGENYLASTDGRLYRLGGGSLSPVGSAPLASGQLCAVDQEGRLVYGSGGTVQWASLSGEVLAQAQPRGELLAVCGSGALTAEDGFFWFTPLSFQEAAATPYALPHGGANPHAQSGANAYPCPFGGAHPGTHAYPRTYAHPRANPHPHRDAGAHARTHTQPGAYPQPAADAGGHCPGRRPAGDAPGRHRERAAGLLRPRGGAHPQAGRHGRHLREPGHRHDRRGVHHRRAGGDCDGSGTLSQADLRQAQALLLEDSSTQGAARRAGDLDGDGLLTTQDLVLLSQRLEP